MKELYVRLKPYKPAAGNVLQRYAFNGHIYISGQWTIADARTAEALSEIFQRHGDPATPLAFDIGDKNQAKLIEKREREIRERELRKMSQTADDSVEGAVRAKGGNLTTADMPKPEKQEPQKEIHVDFDDEDDNADAVATDPEEALGVSMLMKKAELADYADKLGIDTEGLTKTAIFEAIENKLR